MTTATHAPDPARIETGALLLRLGIGAMFIAHALLKYFVFGASVPFLPGVTVS